MFRFSGILLCATALIFVFSDGVTCSPRWSNELDVPAVANRRLSPAIVNELTDFVNLIPTVTIDEIAAKYYITDSAFRTALAYVRSPEFMTLLESALNISEVLVVLDYVHLLLPSEAGAGATQTNAIIDAPSAALALSQSERWRVDGASEEEVEDDEVAFVLLKSMRAKKIVRAEGDKRASGWLFYAPERIVYGTAPRHQLEHQDRQDLPQSPSQSLQSFTSFVRELLQHLPRSTYVQMIEQKRQRNADFAEFYAALRSLILPIMVNNALAAGNVKPLVKTLAAHSISANDFRDIGFQLISWGPPI